MPRKKQNHNSSDYTALIVKGFRSDIKAVIEGMASLEDRLKRRMDERFAEQNVRFDMIESILKEHTRLWKENERCWDANEKRWDENEKRWNDNDRRWAANELRLVCIEQKLDHVVDRVLHHDQILVQRSH